MLENKKQPKEWNNKIEKIVLENSLWGDVQEVSLWKIVPSVYQPID